MCDIKRTKLFDWDSYAVMSLLVRKKGRKQPIFYSLFMACYIYKYFIYDPTVAYQF